MELKCRDDRTKEICRHNNIPGSARVLNGAPPSRTFFRTQLQGTRYRQTELALCPNYMDTVKIKLFAVNSTMRKPDES